MYDALRVKEIPAAVTAVFFVLYFILGNLCLLNLFIAAILQRLKITAVQAGSASQAARAALVMKEALEAEAAELDLEDAKLFLTELQASSASSAVEIAEAEAMVEEMSVVSAKETEDSIRMDDTLRFFGISSSRHTLGIFGPSNPIRSCAQALTHSDWYPWAVCACALASLVLPCFKGHISDFNRLDNINTMLFGGLMLGELMIKCIADGFLWVFPTVKQIMTAEKRRDASVAPEVYETHHGPGQTASRFGQSMTNINSILAMASAVDAWHAKSHGSGTGRKRVNLLQLQKRNYTIFRVLTMQMRKSFAVWHVNSWFGPDSLRKMQAAIDGWHANGQFPPRTTVVEKIGDHNWSATSHLGQTSSIWFFEMRNAVHAWWANTHPGSRRQAQNFQFKLEHVRDRAWLKNAIDNWSAKSNTISGWRFCEVQNGRRPRAKVPPLSNKYPTGHGSSATSFGYGAAVGMLPADGSCEIDAVAPKAKKTALCRAESHLTTMKEAYKAADVNGDGDVDSEEYMEYMRTQGIKIDTRRPFLLTGWNFIDLVSGPHCCLATADCVVLQLVALFYVVDMVGITVGSSLHYSWALRPLRLLSLSNRIQIVVICMLDSIPALFNVILLGICVFFVFAIMGLQIFMGTMFACNDNFVNTKQECVGLYIATTENFNDNLFVPMTASSSLGTGVLLPRVWSLMDSNFDHIGSSFLTLFKVKDCCYYATICLEHFCRELELCPIAAIHTPKPEWCLLCPGCFVERMG